MSEVSHLKTDCVLKYWFVTQAQSECIKQLGVDENNPYLFVENNKIFSIFDVPHLIKSLRNNLIGCSFKYVNMTIAAFSDNAAKYEMDKKKLKLILTQVHFRK